jgi:hypothetical protein
MGAVGMASFNTPNISTQSHTGILIKGHVTVQAAADVTGYNIQCTGSKEFGHQGRFIYGDFSPR